MNFALYMEYIGSQRDTSTVKMIAAAATLEEINGIYSSSAGKFPMYRFRCEDWNTGATVWIS